jgi:FtsP/CotA-like multicopper oxidase with cupredoxin domain
MRFLHAAALLLLAGGVALAQSTTSTGTSTKPETPHPPKAPTSLPTPKAEPANDAYGAPVIHQRSGPSEMDVGPVQRHFVRASTLDTEPVNDDLYDNKALKSTEKTALDKRISVPLIHDVQNDGAIADGNQSMQYELTYLNWGAITEEQRDARRGHYFTITWKNKGPSDDFTARFQYRETKSQEVVRTLSQAMPHVHGATRSYFAVTGVAYLTYGPIVSWRFTILKGDTVVAEAKSFIW